jgi:hypothetical protein
MGESVRRIRENPSDTDNGRITDEFEAYDWYETVDIREIRRNDLLLIREDERIPIDATIKAVQATAERPSGDEESESTNGRAEARVTIETIDGESTPRITGESVAENEVVRGGSVVVEVDGEILPPWVPVIATPKLLDWTSVGKVVVAVVVVAITLSATGLGAFNPVDEVTRDNSERVEEAVGSDGIIGGQGPTPTPPPVTATPPAPSTGESTDSGDGNRETTTPPVPTKTPTTTVTPTAEPTATPPPTTRPTAQPTDAGATGGNNQGTGSGAGSGNSGAPGVGPRVKGTVDLTVTDPSDVESSDGNVQKVTGSLEGRLSWRGHVDSAVLVVQSFGPDNAWVEAGRYTIQGQQPVNLSAAIGEMVYISESRASGFANTEEGTTKRRGGSIAVTAILFRNGNEVGRIQATDSYTFEVTNVGPVRLEAGADDETVELFDVGGGGGSTGSDANVVVPGSVSTTRIPMTNQGTDPGTLQLSSISYVTYENGQTSPEAEVDPTGGMPGRGAGELGGDLDFRVSVVYPNGTQRDVIGGPDTYQSLGDLTNRTVPLGNLGPGESLELLVVARVPPSAGNEIQSDTIVVDASFTLVQRE